MALVKRTDLSVRPWHSADARQTAVRLPRLEKQPAIDYERLRNLCKINGLKDVQNGITQTTEEAHQHFMENYKDIFAKEPKKLGFPIHSEQREQHKVSLLSLTHNATGKTIQSEKKKAKEWPVDKLTHNISDYLGLLHKQRKIKDPELIQQDNLKTLRKTLRKLPFQRTAADNEKIFNILRTFPFFKEHIPDPVLKELCVVALLEVWKDPEFTIFGSTGLHMVLQGKVAPISYPCINIDDVAIDGSVTPVVLNEPDEMLTPGQCFGTLKKIEGREPSSKVFSVITKDNNCEFLKIPATDYVRVIEQIKQREHTEKENLLQSCSQYKLWPRQPLIEVAELIEWISYPPNTVLASEEYKAPYVAIIKSGEVIVMKQINVVLHVPGGKKEKRTKQVVMGRLGPSESFAELSVLLNEQITCSVVTATGVTLGIIRPEKIKDLDEVTIQLFKQSNNRTFGDLTKENIQDEYMQQELKREWNEFKHGILLEVINSRGIRPGYGKWSK